MTNEGDSSTQGDNEVFIEQNSGVEFPGQSFEPLVNSGLRLKDIKCMSQNSQIVIEFKQKPED